MIQPLKSSKTTWFVYWLDLEEPVPAGTDYFLPTLLIVCDPAGAPLAAPDILEELDQVRVESLLVKLFDRLGHPGPTGDLRERRVGQRCLEGNFPRTIAWRSAFSASIAAGRRIPCSGAHRCSALCARRRFCSALEGGRARACQHGVAYSFAAQEDRAAAVRLWPATRIALRRASSWPTWSSSTEIGRFASRLTTKSLPAKLRAGAIEVLNGGPIARPGFFCARCTAAAMTLWHQNRHGESAAQFEDLLSLNPRDNQGVRFFIPLPPSAR